MMASDSITDEKAIFQEDIFPTRCKERLNSEGNLSKTTTIFTRHFERVSLHSAYIGHTDFWGPHIALEYF